MSRNMLADQCFRDTGLAVLESGLGKPTSDETYTTEVAPSQHYKSWDSFFSRESKDDTVRLIVKDPQIPFLYNACESRFTHRYECLAQRYAMVQKPVLLYNILGGSDPNSLTSRYAAKVVGRLSLSGVPWPAGL